MATSLPSISSRTEDPQPERRPEAETWGPGGQIGGEGFCDSRGLRVAAVRGSLSEDATLETEPLPQRFNLQDWRRVPISFSSGSSIPLHLQPVRAGNTQRETVARDQIAGTGSLFASSPAPLNGPPTPVSSWSRYFSSCVLALSTPHPLSPFVPFSVSKCPRSSHGQIFLWLALSQHLGSNVTSSERPSRNYLLLYLQNFLLHAFYVLSTLLNTRNAAIGMEHIFSWEIKTSK